MTVLLPAPPSRPPRLPDDVVLLAALERRFATFMSQLSGDDGQPVIVAHHEHWCELLQTCARLVLCGPRSHGKTTTQLCFILWLFFVHARAHPVGSGTEVPVPFRVLLLSATQAQAEALLERFRALLLNNAWLLGQAGPATSAAARRRSQRWSRTGVRLASGAELTVRPYGAAVRGAHPDVVLLDDVEDETTTGTEAQRAHAWDYFAGVLVPMRVGRIVIVGTPVHEAGLIYSLVPDQDGVAPYGFTWRKYRAWDSASNTALWPEQVSLDELMQYRAADPRRFSREFQGEPIDDASSIFPYSLTDPLRRTDLAFVATYRPTAEEDVVLGLDLAISEAGDYTVAFVCAWNRATQKRRLLTARRARGLTLLQQITQLRELCRNYNVTIAIVENNTFQKWLYQDSLGYPETAGRVYGHRTGVEKSDLDEGVPALKLVLEQGLWELPAGDTTSASFFALFQAELCGFGWRAGKLRSVAPHDDIAMALWFCERGIRLLTEWRRSRVTTTIVTGEDLGIPRLRIGDWNDKVDGPEATPELLAAWRAWREDPE